MKEDCVLWLELVREEVGHILVDVITAVSVEINSRVALVELNHVSKLRSELVGLCLWADRVAIGQEHTNWDILDLRQVVELGLLSVGPEFVTEALESIHFEVLGHVVIDFERNALLIIADRLAHEERAGFKAKKLGDLTSLQIPIRATRLENALLCKTFLHVSVEGCYIWGVIDCAWHHKGQFISSLAKPVVLQSQSRKHYRSSSALNVDGGLFASLAVDEIQSGLGIAEGIVLKVKVPEVRVVLGLGLVLQTVHRSTVVDVPDIVALVEELKRHRFLSRGQHCKAGPSIGRKAHRTLHDHRIGTFLERI